MEQKEKLIKSLREEKFEGKIVRAFEKVKREDFLDKSLERFAYDDVALPTEHGQTTSQPYTIAFMLELLEMKDNLKILEVSSGSGYVLALMNEISKNSEIYGVERVKTLVEKSRKVVESENVKIIYSDGSEGLKEFAPYDRILVSASSDELPSAMVEQLKVGGIMVACVGSSLWKVKKKKSGEKIEKFPGFVFVPMMEGKD